MKAGGLVDLAATAGQTLPAALHLIRAQTPATASRRLVKGGALWRLFVFFSSEILGCPGSRVGRVWTRLDPLRHTQCFADGNCTLAMAWGIGRMAPFICCPVEEFFSILFCFRCICSSHGWGMHTFLSFVGSGAFLLFIINLVFLSLLLPIARFSQC